MNITRTLIATSLAAAATVITSTSAAAMPEEGTDERGSDYWTNDLCHVPVDGGPTGVWVDTFEYIDSYDVPGSGTTEGHLLPCLPTACPDGLYLASGGCMSEDPFAHIPLGDDTPHVDSPPLAVNVESPLTVDAEPLSVNVESPLPIDIGPLIEPAIATWS